MTEKKRGRGRPKGSPNKPVMELITERVNLTKNADVYEILCQADIVAQEDVDKAANGLRVFNESNGAVQRVCQWYFDSNINSTLPEGPTPFNKNEAPASDLTETQLRFEFKKFRYFVKIFFIIFSSNMFKHSNTYYSIKFFMTFSIIH